MKIKRTLALLLSLLLCLAALTACGNTEQGATPPASDTSQGDQSADAPDGEVDDESDVDTDEMKTIVVELFRTTTTDTATEERLTAAHRSDEYGAQNVENAMKFIDFVHRPDIYKMILDVFPGVCVNDAALEIMDERYLENPGSNVDQSEIARANLIEEVGDAVTYYDDVFTKMKTN